MDPFQIYAAHIIAYSLIPIFIAARKNPLQLTPFYIYISLLLVMSGFLRDVFALPLTESLSLSGGSLAYGAFMMSVVIMLINEHNAALMRNIVRVVIGVSVFLFMIFSAIAWSLGSNAVVNQFLTPPSLFGTSARYMIIHGLLVIIEILMLVYLFERVKHKINSLIFYPSPVLVFHFCFVSGRCA